MIYLRDILPQEISDEMAFYLTNFAMDLALAIESYYFGQIKRYADEGNLAGLPDFLRNDTDENE